MTLAQETAKDGFMRLTVAFESERLSYSDLPVDLYNSGINQILSVAAFRGHRIHHFSMSDLYRHDGVPYVRTSLLELPPRWTGPPLEAFQHLRKTGEQAIRVADVHLCFARGDDIRTKDTPHVDLLRAFEEHGTLIEPMDVTLATCDKYSLVTRCPGIPQPMTFAAETPEQAMAAIERLPRQHFWFVLKDRYGYGCGEQVHRLRFEEKGLANRVEEFLQLYGHIILQEYCPEVADGDITVTFFGDRLIGAMRRRARQGQWKTNASLGATEETHDLTPEQEAAAWAVRRAYPEIRLCSVDLLPSGRVLEINAFPGGRGLYRVYGIELGTIVFEALERETRFRLRAMDGIVLPPSPVGADHTPALAAAMGEIEPLYRPFTEPVRVLDSFSGEHHLLDIHDVVEVIPKTSDYILSIPHAGLFVPAVFADRFELGEKSLLEIDLFSDLLFEGLEGIQVISRLAPFFMDMNRRRQGVETDDPDNGGIPGHLTNPPQIYFTVENHQMLKENYSALEESEVLRYYDLYHEITAMLIDHMKREKGYALVIDGHSMTSRGLGRVHDKGSDRDNFVVGTLNGTSAGQPIIEAFVTALKKESEPCGLGLSVARDKPYAGGFFTRQHSAPDDDVHVIQIEVSMDTYMYEATEPDPVKRYALKPHRVRMVQRILEKAVTAACRAAETIYNQ
jgi:glutathione synthase/RimK-type ligase-like ATP-grasp enzyme/N-formylglutamate amidohydrolase